MYLLNTTDFKFIAQRITLNQLDSRSLQIITIETVQKIIAPNQAPIPDPKPPVSKQPPTTAAAIASNSFNVPRIVSAEPASKT